MTGKERRSRQSYGATGGRISMSSIGGTTTVRGAATSRGTDATRRSGYDRLGDLSQQQRSAGVRNKGGGGLTSSSSGEGRDHGEGRGHKRVYDMVRGAGGSKGRQKILLRGTDANAGVVSALGAQDEEISSDDEDVTGRASDGDSDTPQKSADAQHSKNANNSEPLDGFSEEDAYIIAAHTHMTQGRTEIVEEGGDDDEKRLRVARLFLRELAARRQGIRGGNKSEATGEGEEGEECDTDTEEEDPEEEENHEDVEESEAALAALLRRQADARTRNSYREIPASLGLRFHCFLRGHKLPVTCVAAPGVGDASEKQRQQHFVDVAQESSCAAEASLDRHVYTGAKDCCVLRWDLQEEKKIVFQGRRNDFHCGGHFRPVLGLCVAPDESFFCSVGADQLLRIWDYRTSTTKCIAALRGHSGAICSVKLNNWPSAGAGGGTGSSFYTGTQSFSSAGDIEVVTCGADKSLKLWNLALRACLNSYYGHTAPVTAMDVMLPNRPLTVGEDCTARSWKGGVISLHSTLRKRPIAAVQQPPLPSKSSSPSGYSSMKGITAMAALRRSEVFFAGTAGGVVQMWRAKRRRKRGERPDGTLCSGDAASASLRLSSAVHVRGVVTSLCLTPSERALVAAVSKETRLGRWIVDKGARNGIAMFSLVHQEEN